MTGYTGKDSNIVPDITNENLTPHLPLSLAGLGS